MTAGDTAVELAADALAAWRLTHLVTADAFPPIAAAREKVLDRYGPDSSISYFAVCPFCVGVWAAVGVTIARAVAPRAWGKAARMLAVAAAVPIIESRL